MEGTLLDQYVQRLQNMSPFNVYVVNADGSVAPWYEVTGEIVKDVVLREDALALQVASIASQILHWGRHAAQCKRVWEIEERQYRVWRAKKILDLSTPPTDDKGWKKPTESVIEATYQAHPEYSAYYARTERAEEAYNASMAIVEAFKAKRDMIKATVVRAHDSGQPRLTV